MEFYSSQLQLNLIILKQQGFCMSYQPLLEREQEDRGGVYKSDEKFRIAIYLVPVLHTLIVGIKNVESTKNLLFLKKNLTKNAENSISEGLPFKNFLGEHAPDPTRRALTTLVLSLLPRGLLPHITYMYVPL